MTPPRTAATKAKALKLYPEVGATEAARACGVHRNTVIAWAKQAGLVTTHGREKVAAAHEATKLRWEERRQALVHEIGEVASLLLEVVREKAESRDLRNVAAGTTAFGTLVDKAQLLSGGATSREAGVNPAALVQEAKAKALALVPQRKVG